MTKKKFFYKYLIEVLIIVIGVLIAFYLTNWGNEVDKRRTENEIVSQIYFELNDNLVDLQNDLVIHRTALQSQLNIQKYLDGGKADIDSLMMDFYWASKEEYIFPNTSAFENLRNTGMSIVEKNSLRDLITLVYNNNFPRISKGNNLHPDINEYTSDYYKKNFKVNRDPNIKYTIVFNDSTSITYPRNFGNGIKQIIGYLPLDSEKLMKDEEFRLLISEILYFRIYKINYYQVSINNVEKILDLIESEYPNANTKNK